MFMANKVNVRNLMDHQNCKFNISRWPGWKKNVWNHNPWCGRPGTHIAGGVRGKCSGWEITSPHEHHMLCFCLGPPTRLLHPPDRVCEGGLLQVPHASAPPKEFLLLPFQEVVIGSPRLFVCLAECNLSKYLFHLFIFIIISWQQAPH